ncbi:hypothetical protein MBANPS3_009279 [Mucor bainieri]
MVCSLPWTRLKADSTAHTVTRAHQASRHCSNMAVSFGPQCPDAILNEDLAFSCLAITNSNSKEIFTDCRQLNSAFQQISTYCHYRATLFESNLHVPATVFNLYKLPAVGYGLSLDNEARDISKFMDFARQCVHEERILNDIPRYFFKTVYKNAKLAELIKTCQTSQKDMLQILGDANGISTMVQTLSSYVSGANKKLADNTKDFMIRSFGPEQ